MKTVDSHKKLAIVIPAYKSEFFRQSLESIAKQTCKDFTLYIGDDASPANLLSISESFKADIDIVYKRFNENIGGKDLVSHWNRCIDMTEKEPWIWLFSDDDLMDPSCVEAFYKHIQRRKDDSLLHFNIEVINENNNKIFKTKIFPSHFSTSDFFFNTINRKVYSCVVEYIFKRDQFEKANRFEPFDLAWSSDNATWMKLSLYNGINTIDGPQIKWRLSTLNISSKSDDRNITLRKINASTKYIQWARVFFEQHNILDTTSEIDKIRWLLIAIVYTTTFTFKEKYKIIIECIICLKVNKIKFRTLAYWLYEELKRNIKSAISSITC